MLDYSKSCHKSVSLSYNNHAYLYEYIKLNPKRYKPFSSYGDTSLQAKIYLEFLSRKRGIIMQKSN
jgi:hypothetical protein